MLFSATQTRKVEDLARLSLKRAPLYVGVDDDKETSTAEGIEQVSVAIMLAFTVQYTPEYLLIFYHIGTD